MCVFARAFLVYRKRNARKWDETSELCRLRERRDFVLSNGDSFVVVTLPSSGNSFEGDGLV